MYTYLYTYMIYVYMHRYIYMENGNSRLLAANGNRKGKLVFRGRQTIPSKHFNRLLLFQQTCPVYAKKYCIFIPKGII